MVRPLNPSPMPPNPSLTSLTIQYIFEPFKMASDPPRSLAHSLFFFTDTHMFPVLFLYMMLLIPPVTFQSLPFNPDVGYVSPVSDFDPD